MKRGIKKAFEELSPLQREIVEALMRGDDESADDALADRYGTTPGAVRTERNVARRLLREALWRVA